MEWTDGEGEYASERGYEYQSGKLYLSIAGVDSAWRFPKYGRTGGGLRVNGYYEEGVDFQRFLLWWPSLLGFVNLKRRFVYLLIFS